jgi:hypothetical protein
VAGAKYLLDDGEQGRQLVAGHGYISCLCGITSQGLSGCQCVGVLRPKNPLADRQQGGEHVTGGSRVPCASGQGGEVVAGCQGLMILGPEDLLADG